MGLELGLGLGLNKGGYRGDAYNDLVKLSTWFIDPARPQGVKGTETEFNTAKVNPLFDRKGVLGKNLLNVFSGSQTLNGLTITIIDNEITINGTPTTNIFAKFSNGLSMSASGTTAWSNERLNLETGKTYTYSTQDVSGTRGNATLALRGVSALITNSAIAAGQTQATFELNEVATSAYIFIASGTTANNYKFKLQIEEGSTATAYEPYGKANVLMTNVAWTNLDGYRVETINGKTNVFFNLDGVDTFGAVNSASAPNPTGSDDFWVLCVFRPDDVGVRYYGLVRSNFISVATIQYGVLQAGDAKIKCFVDNNAYDAAPSTTTLSYILYGKFNNVGSIIYNGVEVASIPNTPLLTSRPHTQLSCRSNSTDGLTKSAYGKGLQGICAMQVAPQGTIDKAKVVSTVAKAMKQIYGLGV